jgi:ComF family protein
MVAWTEQARRFERWLLPAECLACGRRLREIGEPLVCELCRMRWKPLASPCCPICGEPQPLGLRCRMCVDWPGSFGPVRSAVRLDPAVRALVHQFKYHGWHRLADSFALAMLPLLAAVGDGDLVPIPLAARRRRRRGYNQAELLARAIAGPTGHRVAVDRLRRTRETGTQTRLAPEARRANLTGAFVARRSARPAIVVDDVFTTGATLVSAASALLEAGAPRVAAITFARAELPLADSAARIIGDLSTA